jgi:colanic acid biosynthesis protein WcaH
MRSIPRKRYARITKDMPILCVDVIIRNRKGEYLLVRRINEPKKGRWWVVGGRVLKGEPLERAVKRKVREETGKAVVDARAVGYYELSDGTSPFGAIGGYHAVSIVFTAMMEGRGPLTLDRQSSGFKFSTRLPRDFKVSCFDYLKHRRA